MLLLIVCPWSLLTILATFVWFSVHTTRNPNPFDVGRRTIIYLPTHSRSGRNYYVQQGSSHKDMKGFGGGKSARTTSIVVGETENWLVPRENCVDVRRQTSTFYWSNCGEPLSVGGSTVEEDKRKSVWSVPLSPLLTATLL